MLIKRVGMALVFLVVAASALWAEEDGVPRFKVDRYAVEGNSLLPEAEIAAALQNYTGRDKDFGDVEEALEFLEGRYRKAGYNAVAVILPEQELDNGTVKFKVVEGKVSSFVVEGNQTHDQENILQAFPALKIGATPRVNKLSQELFVSNENPSKKVSLQMISGEREDEVIGSLKVTDQRPWNLGLMADNSGSGTTGDYRVTFMFQHHNLFNRDNGLTMVYNTSPDHPDKVNIYNMVYHLPIYRAGDSLDLIGGYSGVDSGTVDMGGNDKLQVNGKGLVSGVKYNLNLDRIDEYQHKMAIGFDYKEFESTSLLNNGLDLGSTVVVHPLSLTYTGNWGLKSGEASFYLTGLHNNSWGWRGEQPDFDRVQGGGNAEYTIAKFGTNVGYALPKEYQIKLAVNGQYSQNPLVLYEQFRLGGPGMLRGYKESALAGDRGLAGSVELYSPNLAGLMGWGEAQLRLLGFFDAGTVTLNDNRANKHETIASAGLGLRFGWTTKISCTLDWGYALEPSDTGGERGDSAIYLKTMFLY